MFKYEVSKCTRCNELYKCGAFVAPLKIHTTPYSKTLPTIVCKLAGGERVAHFIAAITAIIKQYKSTQTMFVQ
jgi:hypothetical protein